MLHARLVLLAVIVPAIAWAQPPEPVCGREGVLAIVAAEVSGRRLGAELVAGPVGEIPTSLPGSVRCAAPVRVTFFDTNQHGGVPQVRLSVVEYTVRTGRNGLFVDAVGDIR